MDIEYDVWLATKASIIFILIFIAVSLFNTADNIDTPCSVNA
jgi:hypothetical protein